jgi:hypothetical protein
MNMNQIRLIEDNGDVGSIYIVVVASRFFLLIGRVILSIECRTVLTNVADGGPRPP